MGGIALGKGVTSSGLLDKMDILIRGLIDGQSEFGVVVVLTTVVLVSHVCTHPLSADMLSVGRLDVHQPYDCERAPGPDRQGRWEQPPGQPGEPTHFHHWARLFHWNGYASLGLP